MESNDAPNGRRPWLAMGLLAVAAMLLFSGAADHEMTLDSVSRVAKDARVLDYRVGDLLTQRYWQGANDDSDLRKGGLYRPFTSLWMASLYQLNAGSAPTTKVARALNFGNILLHAVATVLLFLLLLELLRSRERAFLWSVLGALLFAAHPAATEAVCTQVGAAEALAAVFTTASLLALWHWMERGRTGALVTHLVTLFFALASKENALVFPAAAFGLAWLGRDRKLVGALMAALPSVLMVAAWWSLRSLVLGVWAPEVGDPKYAAFDPMARFASALAALGDYTLPALFWPAALTPVVTHQSLPPASGLGDPRALVGLATVLLILAAFIGGLVRNRRAALGVALLAIWFFPVSNLLVPVGAIAATRFLYLPMTGLAIALAASLAKAFENDAFAPRLVFGIAGGWLLVIGLVFTLREVPVWENDFALFSAAAERSPQNGQALYNLGNQYQGQKKLRDAVASWMGVMDLERPLIPGTDFVPEDVLETTFQATMNAAIAATRTGDGKPGSPDQILRGHETAEKRFASALSIARQGLEQAEKGFPTRTPWATHASNALRALAQNKIGWSRVERDPAMRSRRANEAEPYLKEALKLRPEDARIKAGFGTMRFMAGDREGGMRLLADAWAEAQERLAEDPGGTSVARDYALVLDASGKKTEALRVRLTALLAGGTESGRGDLFQYGKQGAKSFAPDIRKMALEALKRAIAPGQRVPARLRTEAVGLIKSLEK